MLNCFTHTVQLVQGNISLGLLKVAYTTSATLQNPFLQKGALVEQWAKALLSST